MIYVIKTHIYGRMPHDVYTVEFSDGKSVTFDEPALEALSDALWEYIVPQEEISELIVKFVEVAGISLSVEEEVGFAKNEVLKAITSYDSSENVNQFSIQGLNLWLGRDMRTTLMRRFEAEKATGTTATSLWYGSVKIDLDIDDAISLLNNIEVYACKCYDVTAMHKANVEKLSSVEEITHYNYKSSYPEKLSL